MIRWPQSLRFDARIWGAVLSGAGIVLAAQGSLLAAALGVELVAAAFWIWARAADDAMQQVPRWEWLRRPATALWLAVAIHAIVPNMSHVASAEGPQWFHWLESIAVLWACLELLAALPLARPYSDLAGPLLDVRPWLPVMLPAVGFTVMWSHAEHWMGVPQVRQFAIPLLLVTALLGVLRAFARRQWTATLRWMAVADCALAGVLVASAAVPLLVSLILWFGALGSHAALLAGELRGAIPRRGVRNLRMWRAASWSAWASLSLAVLAAAGAGNAPLFYVAATIPITLGAWVTVTRMRAATERRRMPRPSFSIMMSQGLAFVVMLIGPSAWVLGFATGTMPAWPTVLLATLPPALAGAAAVGTRLWHDMPMFMTLQRLGQIGPRLAGDAYRLVVGFERRIVGLSLRLVRVVTAPFRDLHTGDAQEYLLFLIGVGVLAVVLPLLT